MKTIPNSTPKPLNWIWRVIMKPAENDALLNLLSKFSGEKLKHGEYRVQVKKGFIVGVSTIHTTIVDVEAEADENIAKNANKALENKEQ